MEKKKKRERNKKNKVKGSFVVLSYWSDPFKQSYLFKINRRRKNHYKKEENRYANYGSRWVPEVNFEVAF